MIKVHRLTLSDIPESITLQHILICLDIKDISSLILCNRTCHRAYDDEYIWKHLCNHQLWVGKCYIPDFIRVKIASSSWKHLAYLSVKDMNRSFIVINELVGTWSFRFKEEAGEEWMSGCPWWSYKKANQVIFQSNGLVKIVNDTNRTDVFHNNVFHAIDLLVLQYELVWRNISRYEKEQQLHKYLTYTSSTSSTYTDKNSRKKKKCGVVSRKDMILLGKKTGNCISITLNGVRLPDYYLFRSPINNWGFILESVWALYTSFELPIRGTNNLLEDSQLNMKGEMQDDEVERYNYQINEYW